MQITFECRLEPGESGSGPRFGLYLIADQGGTTVPHAIQLQTGYASLKECVDALGECLTYAAPPPPDLSSLELAAEKVTELATGMEEVGDAIRILGERMNTVEDRLDGAGQARPDPGRRSLLPQRGGGGPPQTETSRPARPSIRRPVYTKDLPEDERQLAERVHGQPFGGPTRGRGPIAEEG